MPIWTFVIDYDGGTYVSQHKGDTVADAVKAARFAEPLDDYVFPDADAVQIVGCPNVYCRSGIHPKTDELVLAHIIKTEAD